MGYKTYNCPISKRCGGCELLAVPYELQLKRKHKAMEDLFGREVDSIIGMERPLAYRYKAATPFAPGSKSTRGRMRCGFYERESHRIVYCKDCLVEAPRARAILRDVAQVADNLNIPAYQEDRGRGTLRHAVVRMGYATNESLLTVVTNGPNFQHVSEFVRMMHKRHPEITSIVQNINDRRTNAILGTRNRILYGEGLMHDKLLGCTFEIGPTSFYQTNPAQTEALYSLAIESLGNATSLLDAYCGTGTIGICAAHVAQKANRTLRVVGVEQVSGAIALARRNARANSVGDRCSFVCGDATDWMTSRKPTSFDAVLLDPPRAGSTPEFLNGIVRLSPKRVVYVSCNPKTQVRDLQILLDGGYAIDRIIPVDMFPHTKHVETIVSLTNRT